VRAAGHRCGRQAPEDRLRDPIDQPLQIGRHRPDLSFDLSWQRSLQEHLDRASWRKTWSRGLATTSAGTGLIEWLTGRIAPTDLSQNPESLPTGSLELPPRRSSTAPGSLCLYPMRGHPISQCIKSSDPQPVSADRLGKCQRSAGYDGLGESHMSRQSRPASSRSLRCRIRSTRHNRYRSSGRDVDD
jgi:hypothetical protein